ncbi:hypothetical protein [Flavobacterium gilvum]|nr:hypothetical protein [Flavobacterium gilvum]KFC59753.1 hypothetical protein FEM08_14210 [Flavobacterium gilvum]
MKQIALILITILILTAKGNAQVKIPQKINDEFAYWIVENYKHGDMNTQIFIINILSEKGIEMNKIGGIIQSIGYNQKNRNLLLEAFHDRLGNEPEYLYKNLVSIGISATSSKYLTDYITKEKYKPQKATNKIPK